MIVVFASIRGLLTFALYNAQRLGYLSEDAIKTEFLLIYINTTHKNNV